MPRSWSLNDERPYEHVQEPRADRGRPKGRSLHRAAGPAKGSATRRRKEVGRRRK